MEENKTITRTLTDDSQGKDTDFKFNHDFKKSISGDSLGTNMVITTGTLDADKTNAK